MILFSFYPAAVLIIDFAQLAQELQFYAFGFYWSEIRKGRSTV